MPTVNDYAERIAKEFGVGKSALFSLSRHPNHIDARHTFWWTLYDEAKMTREEIAKATGKSINIINLVVRGHAQQIGYHMHDDRSTVLRDTRQILERMVAEGASNEEIMKATGYTYGTVRTLRWRLTHSTK